jgi:hypothetical protein
MEIKLGQTVRDAVTGFTGIAIQRRENLNGNVQFAVQPKQKDGEQTMPDAQFIDFHMLEYVDDGVSARVTPPTAQPIELGSKVRDKATGFEGIATSRATFLNGCIWYDVMPKKRTEMFDSNADASFIDGTRLEVCRSGHLIPEPPKPTSRPPGGPSFALKREAVRR